MQKVLNNNAVTLNFLSVREVARMLNVNEAAVRCWLRNGSLKGYKLGKSYRIAAKDLNSFLSKSFNTQPKI